MTQNARPIHNVLGRKHDHTSITFRPLRSSHPPEPKECVEPRRVRSRAGQRLALDEVGCGHSAKRRSSSSAGRSLRCGDRMPRTARYATSTRLCERDGALSHANKKPHTARKGQNEAVDNFQSRCLTVILAPCFLGDPPLQITKFSEPESHFMSLLPRASFLLAGWPTVGHPRRSVAKYPARPLWSARRPWAPRAAGVESFEDRPAAEGRRDLGNRPKFELLEDTGKIPYVIATAVREGR